MLKIGGIGRATSNGKISVIFRIDSGTLRDLGPAPFLDLSNDPNIGNVDITIHVIDNAGMGILGRNSLLAIPVSQFVANLNPSAGVTIRVNGALIVNRDSQTAAVVRLARNAVDAQIPSSGFGTATSKLGGTWGIINSPGGNSYNLVDAANHYIDLPATAQYNLSLQMIVPVGSTAGKVTEGSIVKYAIVEDDGSGTVVGNVIEGIGKIVDAGGYHVITQSILSKVLPADHRLFVSLEIASGQNGTCYLTFFTDPSASNLFQVEICPRD
jgi:hypothetical protein